MRKTSIVYLVLLAGVACSRVPPAPTLQEIAEGRVQIVDLSYPINEKNPYWPGPEYHPFEYEVISTLEEDGVFSGAYSTPEHLGTHIDAPNHFELGQAPVDRIQLKSLIAPIVVVDIRKQAQRHADYQLTQQDLEAWEEEHGSIPEAAVVFALTGWGQYSKDFERYKNQDALGRLHFPGFSDEAARFLAEDKQVKALGIDTLSVDYGLSSDFQVHHIVNSTGGYLIENAASLDRVPAYGAWLLAAPVKIENGSGGQARLWAVWK